MREEEQRKRENETKNTNYWVWFGLDWSTFLASKPHYLYRTNLSTTKKKKKKIVFDFFSIFFFSFSDFEFKKKIVSMPLTCEILYRLERRTDLSLKRCGKLFLMDVF